MRQKICFVLALLAACIVLVPMSASARANDTVFTKLVDTGADFDPYEFGCPAINNKGEVAFRGARSNGVTSIFRVAERGALTRIASSRTGYMFVGRNPSINDKGEVSFAVTLRAGGEAIFRGDGKRLTTIARTEPGPFNYFGFDTSINNRGEVAFKAEHDNFDQGLFVGDGRDVQTYYLASSSPFRGDFGGPALNNDGQAASFEFLDTDGQAIVRTHKGASVTIADSTGVIDFPHDPSINNNGVVAFQASLDTGEAGIFAGTGGPLTTVADSAGPFSSYGFADPSINSKGMVAFLAALDSGEQGIFVGPDPDADRVIGTGDALDGSVVTNLLFCREGLNDEGQIVFLADLEDGRTAIFRGTLPKELIKKRVQ